MPAAKPLKGIRAVIIGGGIAGLSTGLAFAARGARVRVLEKSDRIGGRIHPLAVGDAFLPAVDTFVIKPRAFGRLFAAADLRLNDFIRFSPVDPILRVVFPGGEQLDLARDRERLTDSVAALCPADAQRLPRFLRGLDVLYRTEDAEMAGPPPRPANRLSSGSIRTSALQFNPLPLAALLGREFSDKRVARAFGAVSRLAGSSASYGGTGLKTHLASVLLGGLWRPEGGAPAMAQCLAQALEVLGGRILLSAEAQNIELHDGRVHRVSGTGFRPLRTDFVISTLPPAHTFGRLVEISETLERVRSKARQLIPSPSCLTLLQIREGEAVEAPLETLYLSEDPTEEERQVFSWITPPVSPTVHVSDITDALGDSAGGRRAWRLRTLQPPYDGRRYRWSAEHVAEERDRLLARGALTGQVLAERILTPETFQNEIGLPGGSLWGAGQRRGDTSAGRWPTTCPQVPGLLFAGPHVRPGATIGDAAHSALLAAEQAVDLVD